MLTTASVNYRIPVLWLALWGTERQRNHTGIEKKSNYFACNDPF